MVSHSHLFVLDPFQEAIYLLLMEMIGTGWEFPDRRAPFIAFIY